ncbi:flagellar hook-basal body complex protein FliE [Holophaga foetida]|uniref:flagellar hook-basal body complex protein FliE n=1 Tax=Holophaga foetida TaxID=35839 RepID=UPI000247464C|nr:flagellar hook-basal body complex protein FliE [Holophaga foetida]
MNLEAIAAISQTALPPMVMGVESPVTTPAAHAPVGFGDIVSRGLDAINKDLMVSQTDLQKLATGDVENLHQVMIRLEETRLSFQLFLQVRNRLLEAYQDIMKMQI